MKGWKRIFHANADQKKAGVTILISDKIDFEIQTMKSWFSSAKFLLVCKAFDFCFIFE